MSGDFAKLLERINGGAHGRQAGGATQPVCDAWREAADGDERLLVNAILGFEITRERKARPEDEAEVLEVLAELKAGIERAKAKT